MKKIFYILGLFLLLVPKVNADNTAVNYIFGTINNDHGAYGYCVDLNQNNQTGDLDTFANSLDQFYMGLVGRGVCDTYKADDTYDNYFFGVYYYFPNTDSGKYYTLLNGHNYYYQFRINFWRKEDAKEVYDSLQEKNLLESADGLDIYKFEYFYENYSIVVSVYFSPTENLNRTHMNLWTTRSFSLNWLKSNISTITYPIHNEIGVNEQSIQADLDKINDNINATGSAINSNIDSMKEKQEETNKQLGDLNNNITNDNVDDASSSANDFFTGFESNDYGLTAIVTAPLNFIKSITSSTCTPLGFPLPFVDKRVELPCMNAIYKEHFGSFLTLYQTITFGIVAYWVCVNTLATIRGFKDPNSDRIEVLDL